MSALVTSPAPTGVRLGPTGCAAATSSRYLTMSPETISSPDGDDVGEDVGSADGNGEGEASGVALAVGVGERVSSGVDVPSVATSSAAADPIENGNKVEATSEATTSRPRHLGAVVSFDVRTNAPPARFMCSQGIGATGANLTANIQDSYKMAGSKNELCRTSARKLCTMANNDLLVWIDCEMTGLDLAVDELVEIAVIVTDSQLTPLDPGIQMVIKPHQSALDNMGDFVREMHTNSGLITEIDGGVSVEEAQAKVLEYLDGLVPEGSKPPLAGNSVGTDRAFLVRYMPQLESRLHYRTIDVSTLKELARRWQPRVYFNAPAKRNGHRALDDIRESMRELDYYRSSLLDNAGEVSTEDAQKAAALVSEKYPDLV